MGEPLTGRDSTSFIALSRVSTVSYLLAFFTPLRFAYILRFLRAVLLVSSATLLSLVLFLVSTATLASLAVLATLEFVLFSRFLNLEIFLFLIALVTSTIWGGGGPFLLLFEGPFGAGGGGTLTGGPLTGGPPLVEVFLNS